MGILIRFPLGLRHNSTDELKFKVITMQMNSVPNQLLRRLEEMPD
jgi:hypothetical protein